MNPGMNCSIFSCVTCHNCPTFRTSPWSSAGGGTSIPAVCMTRIAFFIDSCTASNCANVGSPHQRIVPVIRKADETHQLVTLVYAHESAQIVENLYPELGNIVARDVITDFEPHERLAQQYRRTQATLCCSDVTRGSDQRFQQWVENTFKNFCNLSARYNHERPEERAGERGERGLPDFG